MGSTKLKMFRATGLVLLLQAAAYHQAVMPGNDADYPRQVVTDAAGSVKAALNLDYGVLKGMLKNITDMKENLVELMPYLEKAERPVITTAYAKLLDLEGTLKVDFSTTLELIISNVFKYSKQMISKIQVYPKKFKSSLRTLKNFMAAASRNVDELVAVSDKALTHAKTVQISVEAFSGMMKYVQSPSIETQVLLQFSEIGQTVRDISETVATEVDYDTTAREAFSLVESFLPKVLNIGLGLFQIKETPDLRAKVDQTIELNKNLVNAIRKISQELRKAKQNIDDSYSTVVDLKEDADNYNIEKIDKYSYELADKFNAVEVGGKRVEETVVYAAGYQPRAFSIPPARTTTTTTTTTTTNTTSNSTTTSDSTTTKTENAPSNSNTGTNGANMTGQ